MANLLNQNEIDKILNDALGESDDSGESEKSEKELEIEGLPERPHPKKHFKGEEEPVLKYKLPYRSPVIKKGNFILNPQKENDPESEGKKVVWTLSVFLQNSHKKKDKADNLVPFQSI